MNIEYYVLDPTGNITVLVPTAVKPEMRTSVAAEIMKNEPLAEQVGFVDIQAKRLDMAGGEFCGNATLCAAALVLEKSGLSASDISMSVSGADGTVDVAIRKCDSGFCGKVSMPLPLDIETRTFSDGRNFPLVRFCGISHIINENVLTMEESEAKIAGYCEEAGADGLGIMLYNAAEEKLAPLVYVPAADTMFRESSCASGSSAVGAFLAKKSGSEVCVSLRQPGGVLEVSAGNDFLAFTGSVKIKEHKAVSI